MKGHPGITAGKVPSKETKQEYTVNQEGNKKLAAGSEYVALGFCIT